MPCQASNAGPMPRAKWLKTLGLASGQSVELMASQNGKGELSGWNHWAKVRCQRNGQCQCLKQPI